MYLFIAFSDAQFHRLIAKKDQSAKPWRWPPENHIPLLEPPSETRDTRAYHEPRGLAQVACFRPQCKDLRLVITRKSLVGARIRV